jgi:DNA polymerase-3 subunit beta
MDMKYPAYDQIIPKNNDKSLTINRDELIGSLKRTVQFSNDVIKTVKFTLDTMVTLSSLNPKGEQAKEVLLGTYEDEPLEININGVFALSCLQKLDGETVTMTFSTPKRAVLITEENNVMLVMPYQL